MLTKDLLLGKLFIRWALNECNIFLAVQFIKYRKGHMHKRSQYKCSIQSHTAHISHIRVISTWGVSGRYYYKSK